MSGLGTGGSGPWENRTALCEAQHPNPHIVAGHLNADYSVQRFQYPDHPGVDVLTIRRHDGEAGHPGWAAMQQIKNRLAPNGSERFAIEQYPPVRWTVDEHHLYHLWVMPEGWQPGVGLHPGQAGGGVRL